MGNTGNMGKRKQSDAPSRTERLFCPVEGCGSGPYRSDKLWGKGGHMEQMAAKLDGNHSLLLDGRRKGQQGAKRFKAQADLGFARQQQPSSA